VAEVSCFCVRQAMGRYVTGHGLIRFHPHSTGPLLVYLCGGYTSHRTPILVFRPLSSLSLPVWSRTKLLFLQPQTSISSARKQTKKGGGAAVPWVSCVSMSPKSPQFGQNKAKGKKLESSVGGEAPKTPAGRSATLLLLTSRGDANTAFEEPEHGP